MQKHRFYGWVYTEMSVCMASESISSCDDERGADDAVAGVRLFGGGKLHCWSWEQLPVIVDQKSFPHLGKEVQG